MGIGGIRISTCAIILVGVLMLFFPIQQVDGILNLSLDLSKDEIQELYKHEQRNKAEKIRDEIFSLSKLSNPYVATDEIQIVFEKNGESIPKVITRHYEKFQAIKDEEITLAEKKCKEILGGKTITNSFDPGFIPKTDASSFTIDNQTGFMNRNFDEFNDYKLLQISIVEEYRDANWLQHQWNSNPYENNNENNYLSNYNENKILEEPILDYRDSDEFKIIIENQTLLAENIRDEMLEFRKTGLQNPYHENNENSNRVLHETSDDSEGKPIRNLAINWLEPTYVADKPTFNVLNRDSVEFEMVLMMEQELAKNKLDKLLQFSHVDDNLNEVNDAVFETETKMPLNYERNDQGFEFFKNLQKEKAENKLIDILGNKDVHNQDYLEFEKTKMKYYSNLD